MDRPLRNETKRSKKFPSLPGEGFDGIPRDSIGCRGLRYELMGLFNDKRVRWNGPVFSQEKSPGTEIIDDDLFMLHVGDAA